MTIRRAAFATVSWIPSQGSLAPHQLRREDEPDTARRVLPRAGRTKWHIAVEKIQADLDVFMAFHDFERTIRVTAPWRTPTKALSRHRVAWALARQCDGSRQDGERPHTCRR